jgi:hypothetical protein
MNCPRSQECLAAAVQSTARASIFDFSDNMMLTTPMLQTTSSSMPMLGDSPMIGCGGVASGKASNRPFPKAKAKAKAVNVDILKLTLRPTDCQNECQIGSNYWS